MSKELRINGATYAIEIHQNDSSLPWVVMLHGFMGDGRVFDHLVEKLTKFCNPVTVDLLGHGNSEKVYDADRYSEEHQTADIITLVQQLAIAPVFLYGYSMGGRLALKTAIKAPELLKGLILESTNYGINDEQERHQRRKADARRAETIITDFDGFLSQWGELELFQSPTKVDEALKNKYQAIQQEQDPQAMAASLLGFGAGSMEPVREQISKLNKPALVLAGTADKKYINISRSLVCYFSDAQLCHIKAGHRIHVDNPNTLIQEIDHFIEQKSLL